MMNAMNGAKCIASSVSESKSRLRCCVPEVESIEESMLAENEAIRTDFGSFKPNSSRAIQHQLLLKKSAKAPPSSQQGCRRIDA
jgi:hypothetical protein